MLLIRSFSIHTAVIFRRFIIAFASRLLCPILHIRFLSVLASNTHRYAFGCPAPRQTIYASLSKSPKYYFQPKIIYGISRLGLLMISLERTQRGDLKEKEGTRTHDTWNDPNSNNTQPRKNTRMNVVSIEQCVWIIRAAKDQRIDP